MDIEPHHITTVSRRPLVGSDAPRTLAEYQAPIIAKYGYLPSWPELAKHEGRTRRLINRHLVLLAKAGKITGQNVKGLKVWERISEAAE